LPLTAAGREAYQKNRSGLRDGSIVDAARRFCVPDGIPRVLANPYPFEIIQAPPGQITIIYDTAENRRYRTIATKNVSTSPKRTQGPAARRSPCSSENNLSIPRRRVRHPIAARAGFALTAVAAVRR
jgi:hypothetical protein